MIISHAHRFIFIKTAKTAGTSVEIGLSKFCGPEDVITPITAEDEALRSGLGYRGPQNHLAPLRRHGPLDLARLVAGRGRKLRYFNHIPASRVKALVGEELWEEYFTFCFERNPWDRVVSLWYHDHPDGKRPPLAKFLESARVGILAERGAELYRIDGEVAVDRVCRYEDMATELEAVRDRIGLPEPLELPFAKGAYRKDRRPAREIMSDADRQRVAEMFADVVDLMGYAH